MLVRLARGAANRRDWRKANERFEEALELLPDNDDLRKEFAGVLFQAGRAARSLEEYDRILARSPDHKGAQDAAVDVCMATRDFAAMLQRLELYRAGREEDRALMLRLARAYAWTRQPAKAAEVYAALVREKPDDRTAYTEYLNALLAGNVWEEFAEQSAQFLKTWPEDEKVRLYRIDALLLQDRIPDALDLLDVMTRVPEEAPVGVWMRASDLYLATGRTPADVAAMLEKAARGRKAPELRARLAVLYGYDGAFHKSFASLDAARREGGAPFLLTATRAEVYAVGQMHRTALGHFETLGYGDEATVRVLKDTATSATGLGRYARAKSALRRAVILFPGALDARFRYVRVLEGRSETAEALALLNAVLRKRPSNPTARLLRGRALAAAGREGEAAADFDAITELIAKEGAERVVQRGLMSTQYLGLVPATVWRDVCKAAPEDLSAQAWLAGALYREGKLAASAEAWERLVANRSDEPSFRLALAEALAAQGLAADPERRNRVDAELGRVAGSDELNRAALARLAELLARLERWDDLATVSARLLAQQPDNGHVVGMHTGALMALGRGEEARKVIEEYLAREPTNIVSAFTLWVRLGNLGRGVEDEGYRAAMAGLTKMAEDNPDNLDIRFEAGHLAAGHRNYDAGRKHLKAVLEAAPDDSRALLWRARLESWDREYDEAIRFYDRYEEVNPSDPRTTLERARTLGWGLRFNESYKEYTRGMERFPEQAQVDAGGVPWAETFRLEREAKWWNWNQRERTAIDFYDRLIAVRPDDAEIRFERGQMDTRLDFSRRAIDAYQRTLLLAPGHDLAQEALAAEEARVQPRVLQSYDYRREKGFGNLFEITEHLITTALWSGDMGEMWWFGAESQEAFYRFDAFPNVFGWRTRVMARKRFYCGLQLDAWLRQSWYDRPDHTTTNLAVEARYKAWDRLEMLLGFDREDVIENFRTLAADL